VLFEQYWVEAGTAPLPDPDVPDEFVLTPSVRRHLATLARAVLLRKHPILLQARFVCCAVCASVGSVSAAARIQAHQRPAMMQNIPRTDDEPLLRGWSL
jgi:hypothetical protein